MSAEPFVSLEEFERMLERIVETLPEDFFLELNGGIHAFEEAKPHPKGSGDDLWILGEYCVDRYLGRSIRIYYGSFRRIYGTRSPDFLEKRLRKNVLHEFRHHLESLAGERGLEIEDEIWLRNYLEHKR